MAEIQSGEPVLFLVRREHDGVTDADAVAVQVVVGFDVFVVAVIEAVLPAPARGQPVGGVHMQPGGFGVAVQVAVAAAALAVEAFLYERGDFYVNARVAVATTGGEAGSDVVVVFVVVVVHAAEVAVQRAVEVVVDGPFFVGTGAVADAVGFFLVAVGGEAAAIAELNAGAFGGDAVDVVVAQVAQAAVE